MRSGEASYIDDLTACSQCPNKVHTIIIPILQTGKLKRTQIKSPAQEDWLRESLLALTQKRDKAILGSVPSLQHWDTATAPTYLLENCPFLMLLVTHWRFELTQNQHSLHIPCNICAQQMPITKALVLGISTLRLTFFALAP